MCPLSPLTAILHMNPAAKLKVITFYNCSILVSDFDGSRYLLCGLGDGSLLSYNIDSRNETKDRRKLILGTKPVNLRSFRCAPEFVVHMYPALRFNFKLFPGSRYRGDAHVFAASDRPTVIHSTNGKLMFSNLNEGEVNHISSFGAKSYPDTLVLVKPDSLEVGSMDSIQVSDYSEISHQFSMDSKGRYCLILACCRSYTFALFHCTSSPGA